MAIVWVRAITGQGGRRDDTGGRQYTRLFRVLTNSVLDGPLTVSAASGIPQIGTIYAEPSGVTDTGAWCVSIDPQQDNDDPLLWIVTCEFSSRQQDPELNEDDPLLRPAEIEVDFVRFQVPMTRAAFLEDPLDENTTFVGVTNSAGDAFDPPVMADSSRAIIRITKNEEVFDFAQAADYADAVNSDEWLSFDPGELKIASIKGVRVFENGIFYWRKTYEIEVNREYPRWLFSILDQGHRYYSGGLYYPIKSGDGTPSGGQGLLDGSGGVLANGGTPVFLLWHYYEKLPYSALNIP